MSIIKYHVAYDGVPSGLFSSMENVDSFIQLCIENAEHQEDSVDNDAWCITKIELNDNDEIVKMDDVDFDVQIQNLTGYDLNSEDFQQARQEFIEYLKPLQV